MVTIVDKATLVWFRRDLRLSDHAALRAAMERDLPIIPVYIWEPQEAGTWKPGAATRWWLHQSLLSLQGDLERAGSRMILRKGNSLTVLRELAAETGAGAIYWSRRYEPAITSRDTHIKASLRAEGLQAESFNASLLHEPWEIRTKTGTPFRVFTPFSNACLAAAAPPTPLPAPRKLKSPRAWPASLEPTALKLEPKIDWAAGFRTAWSPGTHGAEQELRRFVQDGVTAYSTARDRPDQVGTSRLSPHLHFGEISPRQVWHTVCEQLHEGTDRPDAGYPYLRQLLWRDFAYHLLCNYPETPDTPLREEFVQFPWREDKRQLNAWQTGQTGYPIVDAGMRELWTTGWMHNRVRMIVASFLIKDLLIPWQTGAKWFWDTLVDADLANNTLGWQWVGGCGSLLPDLQSGVAGREV